MKIKKISFDHIISEENLKMWVINDIFKIDHKIRRIFFIDSLKSTSRGDHAHKSCWQTLINIKGKFKITIDNGNEVQKIDLDNIGDAITIPPMHWCKQNYSNQSYLMVLCSDLYDQNDYIRNYKKFKKLIKL